VRFSSLNLRGAFESIGAEPMIRGDATTAPDQDDEIPIRR
jgi:hypothetical protein